MPSRSIPQGIDMSFWHGKSVLVTGGTAVLRTRMIPGRIFFSVACTQEAPEGWSRTKYTKRTQSTMRALRADGRLETG